MSLEAALAELTTATKANTSILERVLAGQAAALEKIEGTKAPATRASRAGKTTETPPAETGKAEPAATASSEPAAIAAYKAPTIADAAALQAYVGAWTGAVDGEDKVARVNLLKAIAASLGVDAKFAALFPHAATAVFLIERAKALGIEKVDLDAAYDFAGDPKQDAPAAAEPAEEASDF